ncbi:MAG: hypothetical protein AAF372_03520, partial [Pseudomonadota bacterium]
SYSTPSCLIILLRDDGISDSITSILSTIRSHEFAKEVCELPGYELDLAGTLVNAKEFLSDKPDLPK